MLEELLNLRKEFVKKRERFRILNHHYNELLIKKHTLNEQNNSFPAIEKSKAYKTLWRTEGMLSSRTPASVGKDIQLL